jgi:uncharacterized protein (DUF2252 family)
LAPAQLGVRVIEYRNIGDSSRWADGLQAQYTIGRFCRSPPNVREAQIAVMKKKKSAAPRPTTRQRVLDQRRALKMAESPHAYVRGSTVQFYRWLDKRGERAIPKGPPVWICGDCHAGNLGPLAAADGSIHVQIRDVDQTVIGNPNHDLIRLGLSLASAARGSDLPGVVTAHMLEQMMIGYQRALRTPRSEQFESDKPDCIKLVMRRALSRTWKHLARERLNDVKPKIPKGERFWPLTDEERKAIDSLFAREAVRRLVASLKSRSDEATIEVLDAAYWMKGCSSLGRLRFAVLVNVSDTQSKEDEVCLVDIKEAAPSAAPRSEKAKMPTDNGERVVAGAKHLSPALGERMLAAKLVDCSVIIRELMPQDLKLDIDRLSRREAVDSARYLAEVVGKAHARQMDHATRREFRQMFAHKRSARLEAPSWLWSSVVELTAAHEIAYLEHCRRYLHDEDAS